MNDSQNFGVFPCCWSHEYQDKDKLLIVLESWKSYGEWWFVEITGEYGEVPVLLLPHI
jgi:hypothetical protein